MATLRQNVAQLYTPIYDKFMLEGYAMDQMVAPKVFTKEIDPTKEWKYDDISEIGEWTDAEEGSGGGYQDPVLGYPKTITPTKKWGKFKVSFEAVDQDEYALVKKIGEAKSLGKGCHARMEHDMASFLYDSFSTANSPDGQYLWDTDHPKNRLETGTTYDNLLTGAFSHDNLESAETQIANNHISMAGFPIASIENPILLYPVALRGAVQRVLSERAQEQPDTTVRNINRFAGKYTPIEWKWLGSQFGGSDTAWYIIFPELAGLTLVMNAEPHFASWVDEENEYFHFKGRVLYDYGACNWRCGFASTGV